MIHVQKILDGCITILKQSEAPTEEQLSEALGLQADVGAFSRIESQAALLLANGRCREANLHVSVSVSFHRKRQISVSFEDHDKMTDPDQLRSLAPGVQVLHSKTGLGRAYVFERDGVRCAVTVSNATNAIDGVLCEAL